MLVSKLASSVLLPLATVAGLRGTRNHTASRTMAIGRGKRRLAILTRAAYCPTALLPLRRHSAAKRVHHIPRNCRADMAVAHSTNIKIPEMPIGGNPFGA